MNVLTVLTSLRCQDGIASHLATLLPGLRAGGVSLSLVVGAVDCPPASEGVLTALRSACDRYAVDPALADPPAGGRTPARVLGQARALRRWAATAGADVVHLHGRGLGPATLGNRLLGGPPRVFTKHLADPPRTRAGRWRSAGRRGSSPLWGDRAIAISHSLAADLTASDGFRPARVRYVPHGVDPDHFRPPTAAERAAARARFGLGADAMVCVQLARLGRIKRPDTLVAACRTLRGQGMDVVALLSGYREPHSDDWLRTFLPDEGTADPAVRVVGQQDARAALWAADAKVLCSEREGFATSIVEAMACGLVPVRTRVEGSADQIRDGANGLLFDPGDVAGLTAHLAGLYRDPAGRRRLSAAARTTAVTDFAASRMADRVIAVYGELVSHPPNPATRRVPVLPAA